jgi:xylulokinase
MNIFLGLDSSTQGLKAIVIDADAGKILNAVNVNFGKDLPEYKCHDGFLENDNPLIKHSDPMLWVAALDLVLERLAQSGAPMSKISGISGSGQQHGSVYLNDRFENILNSLDSTKSLAEQLSQTLSRKTSPIWMDSSTHKECQELDKLFGAKLQEITGSPAIERFTGPQIRKFYLEEQAAYNNTNVIHLVSSFLASVLCGKSAPIDYGDGAGMNLLNLKTMQWDQEIAEATAPGLIGKLPPAAASDSKAGNLHQYFAKYGLKENIPVTVWSGDNPNSLIGTGAAIPGTAVISLGTSDTFFAAMKDFTVDPDGYGHVFGNPAGGFMSLICFKNGSLAREKVKDGCDVDWEYFDVTAFEDSAPGNNGNMMLPYFVPEITPLVLEAGTHYRGTPAFCKGKVAEAVKIRAVSEAQALSLKLHSAWMGTKFEVVRVTGGASKSTGFCQVLADVFQAKIEKIAVADSAGLGAAMRAANGTGGHSWEELSTKFCKAVETVKPDRSLKELYLKMQDDFKVFEQESINSEN